MAQLHTKIRQPCGFLQFKSVRIYDTIFMLHSKYTAVLLFACSCLLSAKQYFGSPIECISEKPAFANAICWALGTYILECVDDSKDCKHAFSIAEGVGPIITKASSNTTRMWLRYYQWIVLVLLLQAIIFYIPSYLWKIWEGERLKQLCANVDQALVPEELYNSRLKMLLKYFSSDYHNLHFYYMLKYLSCELLNVCISILNIMALDIFLSGFWSKFTQALIAIPSYDWTLWNHMSSTVFPKVAKCDVQTYGPGGSKQFDDALCLLPLNILNEKIFAFMWCWFLFIAILAAFNLLYYIMLLFNTELRLQLLRTQIRSMPKVQVRRVLKDANIGDWFILFRVGININPMLFQDLMLQLYEARRVIDAE